MGLMEFLKKHKNALLIGFCISTFLLSMVLIILANVDLLVLMALITLLTPPGFSFALLGILILGSIMGAFLWAGLKSVIHYIYERREQRKEKESLIPLVEEDKQTAWLDKSPSLLGDHTSDQALVLMNKNDNPPETFLSPEAELGEFSKEANRLLAQLNTTISNQEGVEQLANCFRTFKKVYYRLAKKFHPDKGVPDKVVWSTQQFQTLNDIYSKVKMRVDRKLESLPQKSEDELLEEENQLLKELINLLKKHLKWLKEAEEELKLLIDNLGKGVAQNEEGIRLMGEGVAQNEQGLARNAQGITQNAESLKKHVEFNDYAEATLEKLEKDQELLVSIAGKAFQKDKKTPPPEGKSKDEKTSSIFEL